MSRGRKRRDASEGFENVTFDDSGEDVGPDAGEGEVDAPTLGARSQMENILNALDANDADFVKPTFVPESPVKAPTLDQVVNRGGHLDSIHDAKRFGNANISAAQSEYVKELQAAMSTKDAVSTTPSIFAVGNVAMQMPKEVRDLANNLYYIKNKDGRPQFVKGRATAIFDALFGPLAPRVAIAAAREGFDQKPLVWVSQKLWHHIENDEPHKFKQAKAAGKTESFNESLDRDPRSAVIRVLVLCFYPLTVKNMTRIAQEHDISLTDVLRVIFEDICNDTGVPVPGVEEVPQPNPVA